MLHPIPKDFKQRQLKQQQQMRVHMESRYDYAHYIVFSGPAVLHTWHMLSGTSAELMQDRKARNVPSIGRSSACELPPFVLPLKAGTDATCIMCQQCMSMPLPGYDAKLIRVQLF